MMLYVIRKYSGFVKPSQQSKLQTALRPFIFTVHPDLFVNYPHIREVNERSLALLHEYIQSVSIQDDRFIIPSSNFEEKSLVFYQKTTYTQNSSERSAQHNKLNITLQQDVTSSIAQILKQTDLYDENVSLKPEQSNGSNRPIDWINAVHYSQTGKAYPFTDIYDEISRVKTAITLQEWLSKNISRARKYDTNTEQLREQTESLINEVLKKHNIQRITWNSRWNTVHRYSAIRSLDRIIVTHAELGDLIKDRCITFTDSGSSVLQTGHIALSTDQTEQQWISFMSKNVRTESDYLDSIPKLETRLSNLLYGMKIIHRSCGPLLSARQYCTSLSSLVSRLGMVEPIFRVINSDNAQFEQLHVIIVGGNSEDLTMTSEGYFSIPNSCPLWMLKSFLLDNYQSAPQLQRQYIRDREEAEQRIQSIMDEYALKSLTYEQSINLKHLLECLKHMQHDLPLIVGGDNSLLSGLRVEITPYFSVSTDGLISIKSNYWETEL